MRRFSLKDDFTSWNTEFVAPYNDQFDFYFAMYTGAATVNVTMTKFAASEGGTEGGLDPLTIGIIAAVVIVVILVIGVIALRMRKKPALSVPPPPPPPPPPAPA